MLPYSNPSFLNIFATSLSLYILFFILVSLPLLTLWNFLLPHSSSPNPLFLCSLLYISLVHKLYYYYYLKVVPFHTLLSSSASITFPTFVFSLSPSFCSLTSSFFLLVSFTPSSALSSSSSTSSAHSFSSSTFSSSSVSSTHSSSTLLSFSFSSPSYLVSYIFIFKFLNLKFFLFHFLFIYYTKTHSSQCQVGMHQMPRKEK